MRLTEPKARLIAEPSIRWDVVRDYLDEIGGLEWYDRVHGVEPGEQSSMSDKPIASDAELLCEYAGRRCYKSWTPGLNANVTKVREDSGIYLDNVLSSKHGAVLEHAQFTFDFDDVSRVFTHELVRHRAGVAISQESLRYVRLTDLGFWVPDILKPHQDKVISIVETLEEIQRDMADEFGLDDEGVPFDYKKEVTSALRRLAPIGLSTGMVWSANIRTLRHVLALRTSRHAEQEIRLVFGQVAEQLTTEFPLVFGDFTKGEPLKDGTFEWLPKYEKV